MEFTRLVRPTKTISIPVIVVNEEGKEVEESFDVTFLPNEFTPRMEQDLKTATVAAKAGEKSADSSSVVIAGIVSKLIKSWTILEDGVPMPTTQERLIDLPLDFLVEVFGAITGAMKSGDPKTPSAN